MHKVDEYAHARERHNFRDEMGILIGKLELRVIRIENDQLVVDKRHQRIEGALGLIRAELAVLGVIVTAFGAAVLIKIWGG